MSSSFCSSGNIEKILSFAASSLAFCVLRFSASYAYVSPASISTISCIRHISITFPISTGSFEYSFSRYAIIAICHACSASFSFLPCPDKCVCLNIFFSLSISIAKSSCFFNLSSICLSLLKLSLL